MRLFISYSRGDAAAIELIRADLVRANHQVWFDEELEGGQQWWDAILEQIRTCSLFVFAVSPASIASRACRRELEYAIATNRPLLPIMLRDTNVELAPDPIGTTQIVDYRERTSENTIALLVALGRTQEVPPPDLLPEAPAAPVAELGPIRDRLAAAAMSFPEQQELVAAFQRRIGDVDQQATLLTLLQQFRARPDVASGVARELDRLIAAVPVDDGSEQPQAPRTPLAERDPDAVALLRSLATHARGSHLTPILGLGLTDSLIGSRRALARQWAKVFEYPMAKHHQDDLASVAQFVTVTTNTETLRASLADYLRERLRDRPGVDDAGTELSAMLGAAWRARTQSGGDVHTTLAKLPCPIYVNAAPWGLLAEALRAAGKEPVVELCRWRPDVYDWPKSIFEDDAGYVPSPEQPLVFQVFGALDCPDSLVITEDDYFDFLYAVAEDRSLVPPPVRRALADSALTLIGFGLEDWDVRVLLRTLVSQEGASKLHRYTHVAAQVDLTTGVISPTRAQRYLERYFGKFRQPAIDIYWGSVDSLAADLDEIWETTR